MTFTYDLLGDVYVSDCGRFWLRESAPGAWDVLDWIKPFRSGAPKLVDRCATRAEAEALADEESEWGALGENLTSGAGDVLPNFP